jgi:hypothetical protein
MDRQPQYIGIRDRGKNVRRDTADGLVSGFELGNVWPD